MRYLFLLSFCLFISSCSLMSDTEKAAITDILEVYGGQISYSIGTGIDTDSEFNGKYLELEISGSQYLNTYFDELSYYAPIIALTFYQGITDEERKNYDYYVVIVNSDNSSREEKISTKTLERLLVTERNARKGLKNITSGRVTEMCNSIKKLDELTENCDSIFTSVMSHLDSVAGKHTDALLFAYIPMVSTEQDSMRFDRFLYHLNYEEGHNRITISVPRSGEDSLVGMEVSDFTFKTSEENTSETD